MGIKSKTSAAAAVLLIFILLCPYGTAQASPDSSLQSPLNTAVNYIMKQEESQLQPLSPWGYIGLAVAGKSLHNTNVSTSAQIQFSSLKSGETNNYSVLVLTLLAMGNNPYDYQGQNLVQKIQASQLADGKFADNIDGSGLGENGEQVLANTHMWAVLALKAAGAYIPYAEAAKQWLVEQQHSDGSFNWNMQDNSPDVDSTGIALMALGAMGESGIQEVSQAVSYLKSVQDDKGGFASWGAENLESASMAISGIIAVGLDPAGSEWSKPGGSLLTSLLGFQLPDGSFCHDQGRDANMMASEQALLALSQLYYGKPMVSLIQEKSPLNISNNAAAEQRIIRFKPGEFTYELYENGQKQVLEADAAPFAENGRIYVPLRHLALSLEIPASSILWEPSSQAVTLASNGVEISLALGKNIIYINNEEYAMDVVSVSKPPGRIFLPARYIAEAFDYSVTWDQQEQAVIITRTANTVYITQQCQEFV
ncbi:MAG: stalk domain-containing protein [Syntrophomonas sp.]|nr:stalk domain-containing protein [Syntrophomonas sp.]